MNRIVLIGNGFDLAHGMNTSYKHFICWYLSQWGSRLLNGIGKELSDGLLSMKIKEDHGVGSPDHFQESDISMLYYLSHSHFT